MEEIEAAGKQIHAMYWKAMHLMEEYETAEVTQFLEKAREAGLVDTRKNMTEVHVISCIGNNEPINITMIADKMDLSKASISKISVKLQEEGFIRKSQLNDNKKEIYFRLTPKGKKLFMLHEDLHQKGKDHFFHFLQKYSLQELHFIKRLIQDITDELEQSLIDNGKKDTK
ncbi:MarR family transcriptional regulator [Paenibacillus sp. N1-5-1-14]|uniref:MarR family transcriptional regulator n=1 Tax=Paenibacillus radicibacter TaxID=2972488 RepID=UPI0021590F1A|nr:MarR family transcriptional regulator [Paenibacillus radicibacter]MCR8643244.1 MarR family transcriptional regulator [Paenibacillus radicibacter]